MVVATMIACATKHILLFVEHIALSFYATKQNQYAYVVCLGDSQRFYFLCQREKKRERETEKRKNKTKSEKV